MKTIRFEYTVYDLVGQSVMSGQARNSSAQIDLGACHSGIYFVAVTWEGKRVMQKVILQ